MLSLPYPTMERRANIGRKRLTRDIGLGSVQPRTISSPNRGAVIFPDKLEDHFISLTQNPWSLALLLIVLAEIVIKVGFLRSLAWTACIAMVRAHTLKEQERQQEQQQQQERKTQTPTHIQKTPNLFSYITFDALIALPFLAFDALIASFLSLFLAFDALIASFLLSTRHTIFPLLAKWCLHQQWTMNRTL